MKLAGGLVQVAVVGGEETSLLRRDWPAPIAASTSRNSSRDRFPSTAPMAPVPSAMASAATTISIRPRSSSTGPSLCSMAAWDPAPARRILQHMLNIAADSAWFRPQHALREVSRRRIRTCCSTDEAGKGGKTGFHGILGYLQADARRVRSDSYREWLLDYMSATECPACHGKRLRPESLAVKVNGMSIADFTALPVARALEAARKIKLHRARSNHRRPHRARDHRAPGISQRRRPRTISRSTAPRPRFPAAKASASAWPPRSAPSCAACSTCSTSLPSASTSATTIA